MAVDPLLSKHPARIAGMFDAIAPRYDLLNRMLSVGLDRRWRARAVEALGLEGSSTVVDLCTGTADLAIAAAARVQRVIGVDFSSEMLRLARAKVRRWPAGSRLRLLRADACSLPLRAKSAQAATIAFGIRNVQDPLHVLREIHRVLVPGGRLAVLEFGVPRPRGLRDAYLWYFRAVLPRIGALVSRHDSAYAYLPASVAAFPMGATFLDLMRQAGFVDVCADPLTLGIVYLYTGRTPHVPNPEPPASRTV